MIRGMIRSGSRVFERRFDGQLLRHKFGGLCGKVSRQKSGTGGTLLAIPDQSVPTPETLKALTRRQGRWP
jgi:hypothetical protein